MDYRKEKIVDHFGKQVLSGAMETLAAYFDVQASDGKTGEVQYTQVQKDQIDTLVNAAMQYLEAQCGKSGNEREDKLTGTLTKTYFEYRMNIIDRSETIPVAVLNVNINDWKYVNDRFGYEESDRLIQTVAAILLEEAREDYIIGRIDGDVFGILIPMVQEVEAEEYGKRIQLRCDNYADEHLAPSVAVGIVTKTNVEERLEDNLSDAEYEMFQNKFEIKSAEGYYKRLKK